MDDNLPVSGTPASAAPATDAPTDQSQEHETGAAANPETPEGEEKHEEKPAKTPEQREIDRLRKSTARLTRQREEARAQLALTRSSNGNTNPDNATNNDTLSLTRAEFDAEVTKRAQALAPTLQSQKAEFEHRQSVVEGLAKSFGQERFDELAADLDDAFGGLADAHGKPKPATDAIFHSDDPKALIEYLADPDNEDEAETIAAMGAVQAGRAIAKLEAKIEAAKKDAKPKPSNAPKPLEAVKGGGAPKGMPNPLDTKAYIAWANEQERSARNAR